MGIRESKSKQKGNGDFTDRVNSEGGAVGNGCMFAEEDDLVDGLAGGFLPALVQVILHNYALVVEH